MELKEMLNRAVSVVPSKRQMEWFDTEFYAFAHFGVNTFTNRGCGLGNEDEKIFNPEKLDCDQWVEAVKTAGMKGIIITAKHHDGFCLWQSKYTEHCVKNSSWRNGKGDVVAELAKACERGGIKFGFYLSPWDRNSKYYGSPEYNNYYCNQLTELLNNYGECFSVWFDGACDEGPNGKKQVYDYERYIETIRKYQPNAVIFNDFGPDVRWVGNESGDSRESEWAVLPSEFCYRCEVQTGPMALADGDLSFIYNSDSDVGSLSKIMYSKGLVFCGAETDMSIRRGWFWSPSEEPHSLERLMKTYIGSVGSNTCFNLNVPPNRDGLIDEKDVQRLKEFGELLRSEFAVNLAKDAKITKVYENENNYQSKTEVVFPEKRHIKYVVLQEDLMKGQRVESFRITTPDLNCYTAHYIGTTIGHKKICKVDITTDRFTIFITGSRGPVQFRNIEVF